MDFKTNQTRKSKPEIQNKKVAKQGANKEKTIESNQNGMKVNNLWLFELFESFEYRSHPVEIN